MVETKITIDGEVFKQNEIVNLKVFLSNQGHEGYGLCHSKLIISSARCELCLVKVNGKIVRSCEYFVNENIDVVLDDDELRQMRSSNFEILVSDHATNCEKCHQNGICNLQRFSKIHSQSFLSKVDNSSIKETESISRGYSIDHARCINCSLCVDFSKKIFKDGFFSKKFRGKYTKVSFNREVIENIDLGRYRDLCPTGAIHHDFDKRTGVRSSWSTVDCVGCEQKCKLKARTIDQRFLDIRSVDENLDQSCEEGRLWWQSIDFWRLNSTITVTENDGVSSPIYPEEVDKYIPRDMEWAVYLASDLYSSEVKFWKKYHDKFSIKILSPSPQNYESRKTPKNNIENNSFENTADISPCLEGVILIEPFWGYKKDFIEKMKLNCKYLVLVRFGDTLSPGVNMQLERNSWMSEYKLLPAGQKSTFGAIIDLIEQKARN